MPAGSFKDDCTDFDVVERWFRALDQRIIQHGTNEWALQVTGILRENDVVWIQIADNAGWAGSVVLRVKLTTTTEQAVRTLAAPIGGPYPKVINA